MNKLYKILDDKNLNIENEEYMFIILWRERKDVEKLIEEYFLENILEKKNIVFKNQDERYKAVCKIYNDNNFEKDTRSLNQGEIILYIIKLKDSVYKIIKRGRTTEPRNMKLFNFKHHILPKVLSVRRADFFHSSDNVFESYCIINAFKLKKDIFHTPYCYVDINSLYVAVWTSYPHNKIKKPYNFVLKKLSETSQFKYLNGEKSHYLEFIKKCDPRNLKDFEKLIKNFDYSNYNSTKDLNKLVNIGVRSDNKFLIIDGCHRASLLLYNKINYIKVYIRSNSYPFYEIY